MKIVIQNVFWLLVLVAYQYLCLAKDQITIGVISNELQSQEILPINSTTDVRFSYRRPAEYLPIFQVVPDSDYYKAHQTLCELLVQEPGTAALLSPQTTATTPLLESIAAKMNIPYISTVWSEEKYESQGSVLNFFPEPSKLARGIAEIVRNLQWKSFVLLYEDEAGLLKLQEVLKLQEYSRDAKKNSIAIKKLGDGPNYRPLLKQINATERNVLLDCRTEVILPLLNQAKELNLLDLQDSYFLTSLDAHTLNYSGLNTTANITTIRIFNYNSEDVRNAIYSWESTGFDLAGGKRVTIDPMSVKTGTALVHDAMTLLVEIVDELHEESPIDVKPLDCSGGDENFEDGSRIVQAMLSKTDFVGLTSPLAFDEFGNRINFNIYVVDVQSDHDQITAIWYATNESITLTRSDDDAVDAAVASLQKTIVRVTSRLGAPYLMENVPENGEVLVGNARYRGYSMDLISEIAKKMGFKFEFHLAEDGKYGNWDEASGRWNGLVGDLVERKAHMGICDLTITHERREVIDFSMPFMTLGISILYKKPKPEETNMYAFMEPFDFSVWIYTATLYLFISVVLYFVSRMTPGDWESPHPCDENPEELENIWDLKNCLWLTLGSIMTQGCDILPKGVSSRMAVSMWWFFSLIMTSSYTANLAAFLTKANLEAPIDSAEALAQQTKVKYGLMNGGSTMSFFKNSNFSTYQRMWTNMVETKPSVFVDDNNEGVARVQNTKNSLYAFLMESTGIEYQIETKCDLKQIGNWLDSKSYGIGLPMNAAYRSSLNAVVLGLQESGQLATLKKRWWKEERSEPSCNKDDEEEDGADLALANVGGVFILLGIGVAMSFALALMEFLWNVRTVSVDDHLSYCEALVVELKFAFSFWITKKRTKPAVSESSSSASTGSGNSDGKSMIRSIIGSFMNLSSVPGKPESRI